jgi:hypothetical protein
MKNHGNESERHKGKADLYGNEISGVMALHKNSKRQVSGGKIIPYPLCIIHYFSENTA